ncbi:cobalt transport protein [Mycobacteroides abscessus subsp. abscessus]|nr:cobalt transport protein [Mycobacteroides abscessus subsp. abscessus]
MLRAARRLRPKERLLDRATDSPLIDILTAAMAVASRRATELGETPTRRDAVALAVVLLACAGAVVVDLLV